MPGSDQQTRCPLNAPGDFYSVGNCLACGLPEGEAPDLLAPLNEQNNITHLVRQPQTPDDIERACRAVRCCCVQDLRYGGQNLEIIHLLGNDPDYCDYIISERGELVLVERPLPEPVITLSPRAYFHLEPWSQARYDEPFTVAAIHTTILLVPVVVTSTVVARGYELRAMLIAGGFVVLGSLIHAYLGAVIGARKSSIITLFAMAAALLALLGWWCLS
jgi:hypothetical protein